MNSLILKTTTRVLMPMLLVFSVFLLIRGHNEPGGGFSAGLVTAAGFALYSVAFGAHDARRVLRVDPRQLIGFGLLTSLGSGVIGLLMGGPFLKGVWTYLEVPGLGKVDLGTPALFDVGVYLVVVGVTINIIFAMEEA